MWSPCINDLPDDAICNVAIQADDTTLYFKCDQASDLWQQLELASELESDLQDTIDWGRNQPVDFNSQKAQPVSFEQSNNSGATDVKRCIYSWKKIIFWDVGTLFLISIGLGRLHCIVWIPPYLYGGWDFWKIIEGGSRISCKNGKVIHIGRCL